MQSKTQMKTYVSKTQSKEPSKLWAARRRLQDARGKMLNNTLSKPEDKTRRMVYPA